MKIRAVLFGVMVCLGVVFVFEGYDRLSNLTLFDKKISFASKVSIEMFTKNRIHDGLIMMNNASDLGGEIVSLDPVTFLMDKRRTLRFIGNAGEKVDLPIGTKERVEAFLSNEGELDQILVEIKFLEID